MKKTFLSSLMFCAALAASAQYTIYPVPQQMTQQTGTTSFSSTVTIVCGEGIDQATKNRAEQVLKEHGLTATFADKAPATGSVVTLTVNASLARDGKFDAHNLVLAKNGSNANVNITGQHSDAVFMGLASLEQMLDAKGTTNLPCVTINDYADQQQRGLVEGYYGYPYSIDVKQDLMRFMMRYKMNSYMYGAKSEPYHHSKWREAYPTSVTDEEKKRGYLTQDMVKEICKTSAETKVNFIWSIHPGNDFLGKDNSITDIMNKYEMMYNLGVRQFGLFVDDVSIPGTQEEMDKNAQRVTALQNAIDEKWNTASATPEQRVKPLNFVPQIYCRSFAKDATQYEQFFTALSNTPKEVIVYTTGGGVWSVPNAGDFNQPKQYLGRDVAWWWNYPCNDNADSRIYPLDMYSNFVNMPNVGNNARVPADLNVGIGIVANPMQQGEVAKIPLFSVADYAWNASGFNNQASWEASFPAILNTTEKAGALKALAPYLAYNDPQGKLPAATPEATKTNIDGVLANLATVKGFADNGVASDKLLWDDLSPWALKLEQMLESGKKLIDAANTDTDRDTRWTAYTDGAQRYEDFNTNDAYIAYTLEGMNATVGSPHLTQPSEQYFRPYLTSLHRSAVKDLIPAKSRYAAAYTNTDAAIRAVSSAQQAYITMGETELKTGEYVGIALPVPTRIAQITVASDVTSRFAVSTSADGHNWTPLQSGAKTVNDYVKYVKIANTASSAQSLSLSASNFSLTTYAQPSFVDLTAPTTNDYNSRNNISDGDVSNFWSPRQNQATGDVICLNYSSAAPVKQVRFVVHANDVMQRGRIEVGTSPDGPFTALKKKGTNVTSFTLSDMTLLHENGTPYTAGENTQGAYIYEIIMDGEGIEGQYVRFYNEQAKTSNWIRVAEFTTEFDLEASPCAEYPAVCDGDASTSMLVPAGTTVTYNPFTAYNVEGVEVFTDRGILPAKANADGTITLNYTEPTRIYEIVARTQEPVGGIFSASAESAQYYGLKFQAANCYISEVPTDPDGFVQTTTDLSTTWAFVGSDSGFKMLSSTGKYLGVKKASDNTDYCYTLTSESQATDFVILNDNGTTFEIARSGIAGTFNPFGGNSAGKKIGFWNVGAANNKLLLVDVEQPGQPDPKPDTPDTTAEDLFLDVWQEAQAFIEANREDSEAYEIVSDFRETIYEAAATVTEKILLGETATDEEYTAATAAVRQALEAAVKALNDLKHPASHGRELPFATGIYEIQNAVVPEDRGYLVDYSQFEAGPSLAECHLNGHQTKHPAQRNNSETSSYWYVYNKDNQYYIVSLSALQTDDVPRFLKPGGGYNELTKYAYAPELIVLSDHPSYTYEADGNTYKYMLISNAATPNVYLSGACGTRSVDGAVRADGTASDGGAPWRFVPTNITLSAEQQAIIDRAITLIEGDATVGSLVLVVDKANLGKASVEETNTVRDIILQK